MQIKGMCIIINKLQTVTMKDTTIQYNRYYD